MESQMETLSQQAWKTAREISGLGIFILGTGMDHPVALEAALKIKELACVHAEGFSTSALKHGPFTLLDERWVVFLLSSEGCMYTKSQIESRGARVILVGGNSSDIGIDDGENPLQKCIMSAIFFQWLGYHQAVLQGLNPDRPRNLAKTVTVP
jgi:glucosamine--fructose-6-phosphate aminotransferase (isomerizing)